MDGQPVAPEAHQKGTGLLAWLPALLLLAAIVVLRAAGLSGAYEWRGVRLLLDFCLYTLVSLGTVYLLGRSFLASGSPGLLLLEAGVLLWSVAGTLGDAVSHGDANTNVTIFNTAILAAGLCHLAGAALVLRPYPPLRARALWLVGAGLAAVAALWWLTRAALSGWLPVFFVPGEGGTAVRYGVLSAAIATFVLSAALVYAGSRKERHPFTSWYAPALALLAVGLFGVMIQRSLGSAVNWLGRTAQWTGGVYLLLAALAALRESRSSLFPSPDESRPPLYREAVAIAVVLAAAALRMVFLQALGSRAPFVVFYPALVLAALYGGWRAGLLATLVAAVVVGFVWLPPLGFDVGAPEDWLAIAVFVLAGAIVSLIAEGMHQAQARARKSEMSAQLANLRQRDLEALRASEERLREEDRRKDEFLGVLSHELRNPLTPIRNSLYILERATPGGEQARRARDVIDRQVAHLAQLVDDLLDVTRISRGKIRLQRRRLDLVELVRRAVEDHRTLLAEREVAVDIPGEPVWVDGDPTRLAQAIGNLLQNTAKFTPEDGKVHVSLRTGEAMAIVDVADTGLGIDAETFKRLFEPFAQADRSLARSQGGLGLGLALVKGMVDLHGGRVSAQSDGPGHGARFTIRLPLDVREVVALEAASSRPGAAGARRILIIEDNKDAAQTLSEVLELLGHQVEVAYDGATGLAKARQRRPELVICDIGLPGDLDGYAVARALRADPTTASVHLVALTGYAKPEDQRRARAEGFDAHMSKPPDLAALQRLLASLAGDAGEAVKAVAHHHG